MDEIIKKSNYEQTKAQNYLNIAGVMIIVLDGNGDISSINKKGCEILETNKDDILGKNWFDNFLPKENVKEVKKLFDDVFLIQSAIMTNYENEIISSKGNKKILNWHSIVLRDENTNAIEVLSSCEDITAYRFNERALIESNLRFQTLFEKAPLGYQSLDINGNIREINQTWAKLLGYNKSEVIGKYFGDFLAPAYKNMFKERFESFKKQGKTHSEFSMVRKDGSNIYIAFDGLIGYDDNHNFVQTYCNLNDITEHHQSQMRIKESEENLKLAQSIAKIGSWELKVHEDIILLSDEARKIFEITGSDGRIARSEIEEVINSTDRLTAVKALDNLINNNAPYNIIYKIHTKMGNDKYISSRASLFTDSNNVPLKVIGVIRDITSEKKKELELEYKNYHDYLTDLHNRRYYFEQLKSLDKISYYPLGIIMMDVNGLKIINDAFGHTVGDNALKTIGKILKVVFGENDVVARVGGDEFSVLLPNTSPAKLQEYKESICSLVTAKKINNIPLSIAIGYEIKTKEMEDIDELQRLAENRMYKHKTVVGSSIRSKAISAILETLTKKYAVEKKHSFQVSNLCKQIGKEMNIRGDELKELEQAGLFHDIGKISIPDEILKKPGKLTDEEFEIIKSHTEVGYQILRAADEYSDLAIYALHHHEKWDGTGYPGRLKEKDIPLFARIITVVDAFEAMTADRPYRKKMTKKYAVSEIIRCSGTQFDPKIAKIFVEKVLKSKWTANI